MSKFRLKDLDVFYLSFDELNCDVNWDRILTMHPTAKRIHGVVGFDRAHRACALASTTPRFVVIDGDNWVNDGTMDYEIDDTGFEDVCYSFKSYNVINGLEYGNGGIKVWDKETLLKSSTHELSDSTDFCWDIRYFQINHLASATVQNCTPYQAWRAGYREGIKMAQINGKPCADLEHNWGKIFKSNMSRLYIWCTVGRDIENGIWAIIGARQAVLDQMRNEVVHTSINDYQWFAEKWQTTFNNVPEITATQLRDRLDQEHNFYLPEMDKRQSLWVRSMYMNPPRSGLMR